MELKLVEGEVHVYLERQEVRSWACPECGAEAKPYDHQAERHLDTCLYQTILNAQPPRAECWSKPAPVGTGCGIRSARSRRTARNSRNFATAG